MAAACGNDMDRHASVEQQRFMRPTEIVEPQPRKAELAGTFDKFAGYGMRVARSDEIGVTGEGREDERPIGQPDQRQVDLQTVGDAGRDPQMLLKFGSE